MDTTQRIKRGIKDYNIH
ncbi:hypothetical protein [Staphylococcus equorum]